MVHGSGGQAAPARSKIATGHSPTLTVVGGATGTPVVHAIVQDTANIQEPRCGENFPLAWWNTRRNRVRQVADGWKAAQQDWAATKRRLRHVWGGKEAS